jgi:hypothetical protein
MISALDCAVLSEDVYNRENNNLASSHGWERLDGQNWVDGFAAGLYKKGDEHVVAFRGTDSDDLADAISDARMVPSASATRIDSVTPAVLDAYGLSDRVELELGSRMLSQVLTNRHMQKAISRYANQAPPEQARQATEYLHRQRVTLVCLTGHSLGGALAKTLSLRDGIPCVAFNSPFMGDLRGVRPISSELVTSINARLDPLSLATRHVGNLPHGREIVVETPRFVMQPPQVPDVESYRRPVSCPRATGSAWMVTPGASWSSEGIYAEVVGPICEATMDMWEPVGRAVTAPERHYRYWFRQRPEYVAALLGYLGDAAVHYHNMTNLRQKMAEMQRFRQPIAVR